MKSDHRDIDTSYKTELIRKAIHLCSIAIPLAYLQTPRHVALMVLFPLTVAILSIDIARHYNRTLEEWFTRAFGKLLRRKESDRARKRLNGASYVLISATLCVMVFPKVIAVSCFLILIISDLMAALVGRRFGKHRIFGKSLEGSLAFFFSAVLIILATPKIEYRLGEYLIGVVASAIGTLIEALPWEIDDNLTIPLLVGAVMWGAYHFLYPSMNLTKFE